MFFLNILSLKLVLRETKFIRRYTWGMLIHWNILYKTCGQSQKTTLESSVTYNHSSVLPGVWTDTGQSYHCIL